MTLRKAQEDNMTASSNPTPNDMPGAGSPEPNPQLQEPVSTTPPPPAPAATPAPETPPAAPPVPPPATGEKPPEGKDWKEYARLWESRAKENVAKAKQWEEHEASQRSKEEQQMIEIAQRDERIKALETQARQEKIARETGVLPEFLGGGTEDEMRAAAQRALEWRGAQALTPTPPPPPPTAAVPASTVTSADSIGSSPNGVQQLTREQFVALSPTERMTAVRAGQCANLGIGRPKEQRRLGNQLELGAHMSGAKQST